MSERVTEPLVRDVSLPEGGTLALITLENHAGPRKPNTFGPEGMAALERTLNDLWRRADAGQITAVAVIGKPFHFAAGADLHQAATINDEASARAIAEMGHRTYGLLADLPVPTFAFISGAALGGGLELALACEYRTVASSVRAIAFPEVGLGLIPGWGGTYHLPRLIGMDNALQVILTNALKQKQLTATEALELGVVDATLDAADFLAESVRFVTEVLAGRCTPERPNATRTPSADVLAQAREQVDQRWQGAALAPYRALDLLQRSATGDRDECFEAENQALSELILSEQFASSVYAFDLVSHRAKHPAGAPDADLARPVRSVGIAGAGLMASQLALVFARRMRVPVIMRDLDDERAQRGVHFVHAEVDKLLDRGRLSSAEANRIRASVTATTQIDDLAQADLVIEAVFEELQVKQTVFAELETVVSPQTILATNTSALSVTAMASGLQHPERVVGIHFFNPVAQMPLVEVVRAEGTDDATYATGFAVAKSCRKSAIAVSDAPGFVVNRLLVRLLGEVLGSLEDGTDVAVADTALRPMGLPMGPFQLLQLVGPAVAAHVLDTLHRELGGRYPSSPGLQRMVADGAPFVVFEGRPSATSPVDPRIQTYFGARSQVGGQSRTELLRRVQHALAEEVHLMLDEGVVAERADIDLGMIMGAGWGFHLGGITPYLQGVGALA